MPELPNDESFRNLIIRKLKKQDLSMKEIMAISGLDRHTANNILRKMQLEGLLRSIGKGRGSKWSSRKSSSAITKGISSR
jgi:transposase